MPDTTTDRERKAFEKWAFRAEAFFTIYPSSAVIRRLDSGAYEYRAVEQAWAAWQARAAAEVQRAREAG